MQGTHVALPSGRSRRGRAVLTPRSLTMIAVSTGTSLFLLRLGYRALMIGGLLFITSSLLLLGQGLDAVSLGPVQIGTFWLLAAQITLTGVGMGLFMPAANNAGIDLLPERTALITGIRGTFRSTGGVIGTAIIVVVLSLSEDKAAGLRTTFVVLGLLLLATIPLALLILDRARERHRTGQRDADGHPGAQVETRVGSRTAPSAATGDYSGSTGAPRGRGYDNDDDLSNLGRRNGQRLATYATRDAAVRFLHGMFRANGPSRVSELAIIEYPTDGSDPETVLEGAEFRARFEAPAQAGASGYSGRAQALRR